LHLSTHRSQYTCATIYSEGDYRPPHL